jgi:hypothetical protein
VTVDFNMPKLVTRYEWWYGDIEKFVKNLWGVDWEGGAAMGFPHQDTYHDIDVTAGYIGEGITSDGDTLFARWMDEEHTHEEAKAVIEKFKAEGMPREEYADPGLELLLNWLAFEGHIKTGKYRVTVFW